MAIVRTVYYQVTFDEVTNQAVKLDTIIGPELPEEVQQEILAWAQTQHELEGQIEPCP